MLRSTTKPCTVEKEKAHCIQLQRLPSPRTTDQMAYTTALLSPSPEAGGSRSGRQLGSSGGLSPCSQTADFSPCLHRLGLSYLSVSESPLIIRSTSHIGARPTLEALFLTLSLLFFFFKDLFIVYLVFCSDVYRCDFLTYDTSITRSVYLFFCFLARRHVESYFPDQDSDPLHLQAWNLNHWTTGEVPTSLPL